MDRYVVIGNPVAHSLSPDIHALFASQTGEAIRYERLLAPLDGFARTAREFFREGGLGANVTLPFKLDAFAFADEHTARARAAGAVNTLVRGPNGILGDNTDGAGLARDLTANLGLRLKGSRILLLGAGGAARGVLAPLLALEPASLVIANRTAGRAQELAERFRADGPVSGTGFTALEGEFDLVINATSSSTRGEPLELPGNLFRAGMTAYDMAYGATAGPFVHGARARGARASDGLGMLVEQAAESFFLWRGRRPQTAPVITALRAA
jgi:shikimate dehydrogenase